MEVKLYTTRRTQSGRRASRGKILCTEREAQSKLNACAGDVD